MCWRPASSTAGRSERPADSVYLGAALARLRDEDVVRLSAYMRRHLNVHGHDSFQLPDLAGIRRALRDPDVGDDEDDEDR